MDDDIIPPETVLPDGRSKRLYILFDIIISEIQLQGRQDGRRFLNFIGQARNRREGASPADWIERVRLRSIEIDKERAPEAANEFFLSLVEFSFGNLFWRGQPNFTR